MALSVDCVVAGTSRTLTTSTGRVVGDAHGPTTQVLFLATAVMVSVLDADQIETSTSPPPPGQTPGI